MKIEKVLNYFDDFYILQINYHKKTKPDFSTCLQLISVVLIGQTHS
jgi:hypothetical protein